MTSKIHPTAIVDPRAELGDNVSIGAFVIIEGAVKIGNDCTIRAKAHLIGPLTMGQKNDVGIGCVFGDRPQHLGYDGSETGTEIGDGNTFREYVTVHRSMPGNITRIGHRNFFMVNAHIAHDAQMGNDCILANSALIGGHAIIEDRAFISGNSGVHQHGRVGTLAMVGGVSAMTKDVPPYWMMQGHNDVVGVNIVGMKRAGIPSVEINAIREAFKYLHMRNMLITDALVEIEKELGQHEAIKKLIYFIRNSKRGICGSAGFSRHKSE
jgi:UDP-N-acetylglucosamine acyltransferase